MKTTTTRMLALAGAVAISFGAAACGNSAPTPSPAASSAAGSASASTSSDSATTSSDSGGSSQAGDILEKAKANALAATSVEFSGSVTSSGETTTISSKGTTDAKMSDITIASPKQGKAHVINVAAGTYIQADPTFWKATGAPASVQKAGEKFIKAPGDASSMVSSFSFKTLADKAFSGLNSTSLASDVTEESVNGVDCWVIADKGGKENGALYVSKDKTEIVRFTGTKSSPGQLDFGRWNEDIEVTAPTADQIMSIS